MLEVCAPKTSNAVEAMRGDHAIALDAGGGLRPETDTYLGARRGKMRDDATGHLMPDGCYRPKSAAK